MNIKLLSANCAKITVGSEECRELGIDYQSFSPNNTSAQIFLASVLARLERMGVLSAKSDKITAEIFEQNDGSLVIYISFKGSAGAKIRENKTHEYVRFFDSPEKVISAVKMLGGGQKASLYKSGGRYALITDGRQEFGEASEIGIAKIKEYWKLLSDTPVQQLFDL